MVAKKPKVKKMPGHVGVGRVTYAVNPLDITEATDEELLAIKVAIERLDAVLKASDEPEPLPAE